MPLVKLSFLQLMSTKGTYTKSKDSLELKCSNEKKKKLPLSFTG